MKKYFYWIYHPVLKSFSFEFEFRIEVQQLNQYQELLIHFPFTTLRKLELAFDWDKDKYELTKINLSRKTYTPRVDGKHIVQIVRKMRSE